ncbi:MAG TPA: peptidase inhibitor family I36 protein [Vicinamibacterales bacterium]|nr:peptidase inhibitor family I36 protein [Vicinamibacterales bacterium]
MHIVSTVVLAVAIVSGVVPAAAAAQRWGRDRFPDSGACFFRDAEFRGDYFCVRAGDDVGRLPDEMNDAISSIRVFGRAEVTVYKDARFNGGSVRFNASVSNLKDAGWNDRISSMRVQFIQGGGDFRPGDRPDDRGGNRDNRRISSDEADRIVRRAYQDVLGRDPDEGGLRQYRSRIIDNGWTEEQVRNSLRDSPEYRARTTMTRAKAEDIVRRAYLNILKREPDSGAEGYINNVLRNNWSQEDVERELRKSPEFRNRR